MTDKDKPRCALCAHWDQQPDGPELGICRYDPPMADIVDHVTRSIWPRTYGLERCSRFQSISQESETVK